jgi:hypothetical protein
MYTVVVQKNSPQNDPPELETDWLDTLEDEELTFQLRHYDTAEDKVWGLFRLLFSAVLCSEVQVN